MTSAAKPSSNWLLPLMAGALGIGVVALVVWLGWNPFSASIPRVDSPIYLDYLHAFQVSEASMDITERSDLARKMLDRAVKLIPEEPAAWANRGLLSLRQNELDAAEKDLLHAKRLAPKSPEISTFLGYLAEKQGRMQEAVAYLQASLEQNPNDVQAIHKLAEMISKQGDAESETKYQKSLEKILERLPNNLVVLARHARAAFLNKDQQALNSTISHFERLAPRWSELSKSRLKNLKEAIQQDPAEVPASIISLDNVLKSESTYFQDSLAIEPRHGFIGVPVRRFLRLPMPRPTPSPVDRDLAFEIVAGNPDLAMGVDNPPFEVLKSIWQPTDQAPKEAQDAPAVGRRLIVQALVGANAADVRRLDGKGAPIPFPSGTNKTHPATSGVLPVDWDNDFRTDLLLAGAGGLRFCKMQADGTYLDVTSKTALASEIMNGDYIGAWAADLEGDGDLDIIVARRSGPALVLRNNREGTFQVTKTFQSVSDVRGCVWSDLDNDGANDVALLDSVGKLHVFSNERSGIYHPWPVASLPTDIVSIASADVTNDGVFDLVALKQDGKVISISDHAKRKEWKTRDLGQWNGASDAKPGDVQLVLEDFDNNGATDFAVVRKDTAVFLADGAGGFEARKGEIPVRALEPVDTNQNGLLDWIGLTGDGKATRVQSRGSKGYHWMKIWPTSTMAQGDDRINSFTLGGAIEIRSGPLVQKQPVRSPRIHFGLGEQKAMDVARIVWPNGVAQYEFDDRLKVDRTVIVEQRLSGSCPFLFANNGKSIEFVADFMWSTPLGMYVNGQNQGTFQQMTEWMKIRGDQLTPVNGFYDLRAHANLWETDYFDQLAMIVVDHPPDTEIFADERFFLTPTNPELFVTKPPRPVKQAWDHRGQDATDAVRTVDGHYLDRCGRGRFQGVTVDHWVEVDLGDDAPAKGPVFLIARGWLHPTDSSINVALEQGSHDLPRPLVLEIPDGKGGWKVGRPALGFPAGKDKTMLIRLDGIEGENVSRRFRLRTNMEIFWDYLGVAEGVDSSIVKQTSLDPTSAELRYRGVLEMSQKNVSSPEVPHYDKVIFHQRWRDLTGYYTRFGDVRELLLKADDRYVIMNAGDEIAMRFAAPAPPPPGWKRDFIWVCNGWTKDGNPNTRNGTTVLPLPAHGQETNDRPPGLLQDDPVYRRFPQDWQTFHTRYVTPEMFDRGLRHR